MKRPKPHLFISPDRLKEGTEQKALCELFVPNVRWVWTSDDVVTVGGFLQKFGVLCPESSGLPGAGKVGQSSGPVRRNRRKPVC